MMSPHMEARGTDPQRQDERRALRAAWVAPMDGPPIPDGAVVMSNGRIDTAGPASKILKAIPVSDIEELGSGSILLPGLVNAHAHLELTDLSRGEPPPSFADWLMGLMTRLNGRLVGDITAAVAQGIQQCVRFGVTTVADVTAEALITRPVARAGPVRVVSFGEVKAMATRRGLLEPRLAAATDPALASDTLRIGLSPHAPYSVQVDGYRRCVDVAREQRLPFTTHLAEVHDEADFLARHTGTLRRVWYFLDAWDDRVPRFAGGSIRMAREVGALDLPVSVLAHANYCDDGELDVLATGRASVAYCPRTHAWFGHPPHRWRDMLARGVNVVVGTDSCASSPDLNLVDDLRLLRRLAPDLPAMALWEMATRRAAAALGMAGEVGTIAARARADFVAFQVDPTRSDPLEAVLRDAMLPTGVWIGGRRIEIGAS